MNWQHRRAWLQIQISTATIIGLNGQQKEQNTRIITVQSNCRIIYEADNTNWLDDAKLWRFVEIPVLAGQTYFDSCIGSADDGVDSGTSRIIPLREIWTRVGNTWGRT